MLAFCKMKYYPLFVYWFVVAVVVVTLFVVELVQGPTLARSKRSRLPESNLSI
jgi:hypothetical protein